MDEQTALSLNYKQLIVSSLKEKLLYFILGLFVISALSSFLAYSFARKIPLSQRTATTQTKIVKMQTVNQNDNTYTVTEGDYLWKIAAEKYSNGFLAYEIAKANSITNPSLIYAGQKLIIPKIQNKLVSGQITSVSTLKVTITSPSYTVAEGDYLWDIAEKAYGDGMMWVRIAKVNSISTPDIIPVGLKLILPRN